MIFPLDLSLYILSLYSLRLNSVVYSLRLNMWSIASSKLAVYIVLSTFRLRNPVSDPVYLILFRLRTPVGDQYFFESAHFTVWASNT